jgi:hypothetical protein
MMKIAVQRLGDSLGILIPESTLSAWGVNEGDYLVLSERSIAPPKRGGLSQGALDELNRSIALAVVRRFTPQEIRARIVANLQRWQQQDVWASAYEEWREIAMSGDDGRLFTAMLGLDDDAVRLRQSMPFVGLLSQNEVRALHEEAAG